jgi:hypothetical protein
MRVRVFVALLPCRRTYGDPLDNRRLMGGYIRIELNVFLSQSKRHYEAIRSDTAYFQGRVACWGDLLGKRADCTCRR